MEEKLLGTGATREMGDRRMVVVIEQLARGMLHVLQFGVSYCVMLLYMSSNGM